MMNRVVCLTSLCRNAPLRRLARNISGSTDRGHILGISNYYDVLGVQRTASSDDIREAFLKLSKEYHPDINSEDPKTHDKFVKLNEAYSVLSKALSRKDYDLSLQARESSRYPYHRQSPPGAAAGANQHHPYYHHPDAESHFYDPQMYSNRDRSQDRYYQGQPYYGVKGISKVSNAHIVLTCFGVIMGGMILHFFAVKKSSSLHIKTLDERDVKTHKLWRDANDPSLFNQRLQSLHTKMQEMEAKRRDALSSEE